MIRRRSLRVTPIAALAVLIGIALVCPRPIAAQEETAEGIKVGGHWLIEVLDPDGSLVSRYEFENALTEDGAAILEDLATAGMAGIWVVQLYEDANPNEPRIRIGTADSPHHPAGWWFTGLTVSSGSPGIVLAGSATMPAELTFGSVGTNLGICNPGITTPADCKTVFDDNSWRYGFTYADLDSPVTLAAGQIVQVTVTMTFQ